MPEFPAPFPLDLSGHRDVPPEEVAPLLERAADSEERAIPVLTALLMNRLLRLLRQGSRQEILDEALMLNRFLAVEAGSLLRQRRPETYGAWSALGELLSGAAQSTSRAAVPALLRGTQGRGQEILEMLAGEAGAIPRSRIKNQLSLREAQLSHLLRDLEEADLIIRYRLKGSKQVLVELGPVGRDVAQHRMPAPSLPVPDASSVTGDELPLGKILHFGEFVDKVAKLQKSSYEDMRTNEALPSRALFGTLEA